MTESHENPGIATDGAQRPFYFVCVFWGEEFRDMFLDYCLASLMAPKNIPSLGSGSESRFLICTTSADWRAIRGAPAIEALAQFAAPQFIEIAEPAPGANKYLEMSRGHKLAAERAFADGARGVYLTPDLVLSDGAVECLSRVAAGNCKVVVAPAMRFTQEGCREEIDAYRSAAEPFQLGLPPRDLMRIAFRNLHPESSCYDWDVPFFADLPFSVFWRGPGGVILHSFSWAPLMVDYGALTVHDASTFEAWTLDGDYVFRNFPDPGDIHVIADSDELALVSFTPADERPATLSGDALRPKWYKRLPIPGLFYRRWRIHHVFHSGGMDTLKKTLFMNPVVLHWEAIDPTWDPLLDRVSAIVDECVAPSFWLNLLDTFRHAGMRSAVWYALTYPVSKIPPHLRRRLRAALGLSRAVPPSENG